eukprot:TRINITY_DN7735_c0_g1_i1.p1 TRINITY_DN7735_c0_g1~~TRINITY_DN7735_c0_g1_i1.p1  ORF type:complete len:706 (+),score=69.92 TRINITY_DN7735_c0_g1_i1:61-2118(+)
MVCYIRNFVIAGFLIAEPYCTRFWNGVIYNVFIFLLFRNVYYMYLFLYIEEKYVLLNRVVRTYEKSFENLNQFVRIFINNLIFQYSNNFEQWPDFGCEGIKVQRAHQPTSQCQGTIVMLILSTTRRSEQQFILKTALNRYGCRASFTYRRKVLQKRELLSLKTVCQSIEEGMQRPKRIKLQLKSEQIFERLHKNNNLQEFEIDSSPPKESTPKAESFTKEQTQQKILQKQLKEKKSKQKTEALKFWNPSTKQKIILQIDQKFFSKKQSKSEVVEAMKFLEEMAQPFVNNFCPVKTRNKALFVFEHITEKIQKVFEDLSIQDTLLILKSLGIGKRIICSDVDTTNLDSQFDTLLSSVIQQGDLLRVKQIRLLTQAVGDFKSENVELIQKLYKIVIKHFHTSQYQLNQAQMLQALSQIRYCEVEFRQKLENNILNSKFKFEKESYFFNLINFFVTFGIQNLSILQILIEQYLKLENKTGIQYPQMIFDFTILGATNKQVQNVSDETLGKLNEIQISQFLNEKKLNKLRLTLLLQKGSGIKVKYPFQISEKINKKYHKISLNYGFRTNKLQLKIYNFLKQEIPDALIQRGQLILNGRFKSNITIQTQKKQICLEVRDASQFTISKPRKLLGQNRGVLHILENSGWNVVVVDAEKFQIDENKQKQYILKQIHAILYTEYISKTEWQFQQ